MASVEEVKPLTPVEVRQLRELLKVYCEVVDEHAPTIDQGFRDRVMGRVRDSLGQAPGSNDERGR